MTRFFVEVVDEPEIIDIIRTGRLGVDWTVISERRYDHPWPGTGWNWLFEVEDPDAPESVAGLLVSPTVTRNLDESLTVEYNPRWAVYPRLESSTP